MGVSRAEFWAMSYREWLSALDGYASQFPEDDGPPSDEDLDALDAALSDEQKAWLGWQPDTIIRQKQGGAML